MSFGLLPSALRYLGILLIVAASSALAAPTSAMGVLDYGDARHLLDRTGFGATEQEIRAYVGTTREAAVRKLLDGTRTSAVTPPPAWAGDNGPLRYPRRGEASDAIENKMFRQEQIREGLELRSWWITEMLATPSPMTERMTLFWHNHFVSSQQKVKLAKLMYLQNVTLRAHALGSFADLLHAIARDPAMEIYLDSVQNRKGVPNENFAREVMELFTLGEGHYSETDIKEAARAFTGWSIDRDTGSFVFRRLVHDEGIKTVLGRTGRFDGDDVVDILLAQPATAELITRKLWREFVSPDPDETQIERIAGRFRDARYDIKVALHDLLTSDAFYARENRGTLIKSPVDIVVGTLHQFDMHPSQTAPFAIAAAGMGQNLFAPPNVKGWPGGEAWINTSTLLARKQFLDRLFRVDEPSGAPMVPATAEAIAPMMASDAASDDDARARQARIARAIDRGIRSTQFDSARWSAGLMAKNEEASRNAAATRLLLAIEPQKAPAPGIDTLALVRQIVLDDSYQLK